MKFLILTLLILIASCKEEQYTQQYNLPEEKKIEELEERPIVVEKELKSFFITKELKLNAYSTSVKESFNLNDKPSSCKMSYAISNYDRSLEGELKVRSESFFVYNDEIHFSINFEENLFKVSSIKCEVRDAFEVFYSKDMVKILSQIIDEKNVFKREKHIFKY